MGNIITSLNLEKLETMKKNKCKSFFYENALIIDINTNINNALIIKNNDKNTLALTFDHRMFSLYEKNLLKNYIDILDLDHMMFTIKPTCIDIIKRINNFDLLQFKLYCRYVFYFNSITRYKIKNSYLEKFTFNNIEYSEKNILNLKDELVSYFNNLKLRINEIFPDYNFDKNFISINPFKINFDSLNIIFFTSQDLNLKNFNIINQIDEDENNLFWIGFDANFIEVPWKKNYPETKWNNELQNIEYGIGIYEKKIKYCNRCCMPETMEGISFDEFGICTPCRSSEEKMHINWEEREKNLTEIINSFKNTKYYDCLLPMSGGKDSMFQAYILKNKYNLNPLAVTHGANWFSLTGRYNLENCLVKFDLDHLIFHSSRNIINNVAKKSLTEIGDACWHCHIGAGTFSLNTAIAWDLKLLIWGESIAERDGRGSYLNQKEASVYYSLEVSAKVKAEEYSDETISDKQLSKWYFPDKEKLTNFGIRYLHLGDFIFWDEEKQVDFVVKNFNWLNSNVENTFKGYKSNECVMAGVHDYANFIKRGIGRATIQASDDVRRGLLTREEGFELAKKYDSQRPHALDYYLKITGYSEEDFEKILLDARSKSDFASKLDK
jgi:N-acetyl sugar amidotransferase